jgi:hypothetical protein
LCCEGRFADRLNAVDDHALGALLFACCYFHLLNFYFLLILRRNESAIKITALGY